MSAKAWITHLSTRGKKPTSGTGLAIGPWHVLTSAHVLNGRPGVARFPRQGRKVVGCKEVWSSPVDQLDVALLELEERVDAPAAHQLLKVGHKLDWATEGFLKAAGKAGGKREWAPVAGITHELADGDLVLHLDTGAEPKEVGGWAGLSGAPVLIGGRVAGVLRAVPPAWKNRLKATPVAAFWNDSEFRAKLNSGVTERVELLCSKLAKRLKKALKEKKTLAQLVAELDGLRPAATLDETLSHLMACDGVDVMLAIQRAHGEALDDDQLAIARDLEQVALAALPLLSQTVSELSELFRETHGDFVTLHVATPTMVEAINAAADARPARFVVRGKTLVGEALVEHPSAASWKDHEYVDGLRQHLGKYCSVDLKQRHGEPLQDFEARVDRAIDAVLQGKAEKHGGQTHYFLLPVDADEPGAADEVHRALKESYSTLRLIELIGDDQKEWKLQEFVHSILARERHEA